MDLFKLFEEVFSQYWTTTIATIVILFVYFRGIAPFRTLENICGDQVPGPMPLPFIGNMLDSLRHKGLIHIQLDEYYKKYGDVFGMSLFGSYPALVVADLKMAKQVYVNDFQAFHDRPVSCIQNYGVNGYDYKPNPFFYKFGAKS